MRDDFGVGLALEHAAARLQPSRSGLKFSMMPLWTSATSLRRMRVRVVRRRAAVRRPARVRDADGAGQRLFGQHLAQVDQLALGAAARSSRLDDRGDAGRVIAAIFQPLQAVEQPIGNGVIAQDSNDSTHEVCSRL
jgi:hypothetical protein